MSRKIWMPLYVADYQLDTTDLSCEQHGVYLILLMHAWRRPSGTLPNDTDWLRSILPPMHGLTYNRLVPPLLERFFTKNEQGEWTQKRLEKERRKSEEISENARRKAKERWARTNNNNDLPNRSAMQSQSQSQSQSKKEESIEPALRAAPPRKRTSSKVPLPDDFHPMEELSPDEQVELERFKASARAHGRKYVDWFSAWRYWKSSPFQKQGVSNGRLAANTVSNPKSVSALAKALERRLVGEADRSVVLSLPPGRLQRPGGVSGADGGNSGTLPAGSSRVRDGPYDGYSAPTDFPAFNRGGR
jgi:uncharacterized protein YdaU (DUF1376 family)